MEMLLTLQDAFWRTSTSRGVNGRRSVISGEASEEGRYEKAMMDLTFQKSTIEEESSVMGIVSV